MYSSFRLPCIALIAVFTALPLHAEETADPARLLVDAMKYDKQYDIHHANCLNETGKTPLEDFIGGPSSPFKIEKGSSQWKALQAAYEDYVEASCARPTKDEFLDAIATSYREKLSTEQLKQATVFYSSEAGQRLSQANQLAARNTTALYMQANDTQPQIATNQFTQRLQALVAESKKAAPESGTELRIESKAVESPAAQKP